MQVTISLLWTIALIGWICISSQSIKQAFIKNLLVIFVLELNYIYTDAVVIGNIIFDARDFFILAAAIESVVLLVDGRAAPMKPLRMASVLIGCISFSAVINYLFPSGILVYPPEVDWDSAYFEMGVRSEAHVGVQSMLALCRVSLFCLIALGASTLSRDRYVELGTSYLAVSRIAVLFGLADAALLGIFNSTLALDVASFLVPGDARLDWVSRQGYTVIHGLCYEPSYFASSMGFFCIVQLVLWLSGVKKKSDVAWFALAFFLLLWSGAFSSMIFVAVLVALLLLYIALLVKREIASGKLHINRRTVAVSLLVALVVLVIAAPTVLDSYYFKKLSNVMSQLPAALQGEYRELGSSDGMPRVMSWIESVRYFLKLPLFGLGPGVVNPWSGVLALLANCGLLGFASWLLFMRSVMKAVNERGSYPLFILIVFGTHLFLFQKDMPYLTYWILFAALVPHLSGDLKESADCDSGGSGSDPIEDGEQHVSR